LEQLRGMVRPSKRSRLTVARRRLLDHLLDELLEMGPEHRAQRMVELARRAPRLTSWLHDLIAADANTESLFETLFERVGQAAERAGEPRQVELLPGTQLGPWRLIEAAGSGGMGTVYRAERADGAFSMMVAIKLIRLQRKTFEERLRLERELLARLDHRNVARLIDGGTSVDGQAYLVMEWIEGRDLDGFVEQERPDLDARLDLFEQMAEGVAHAHQQGVIHGDLKPSNVRVADDGRVCLVDFGVARLVAEEEGGDSASFKALTPAFSAPEQLAGQVATTQSDVWAMGVVLKWLVTGRLPGRHDEKPAPDPGAIPRKADIEAIIQQACHADPNARYAGVARLLDDLRRYRSSFPVRALERTRLRVASRFVQRNRLAVSAASLALLLLCVALAGAMWQAREATLERDRASIAAERAMEAERDASRLADELQAVVDFQEAQLAQIDPVSMGLGFRQGLIDQRRRTLTRQNASPEEREAALGLLNEQLAGANLTDLARAALDENILVQALAAIDQQFVDQPLVRARLLQALALSARGLGLTERALPAQLEALAIRRAWLGDDDPATIDSIVRTASLWADMGKREQALSLHYEALVAGREVYGVNHPDFLTVLNNYATLINANGDHARAERYFRRVLEARRELLGDDDPDTIIAASNLGAVLSAQNRLEEASPLYQEVLDRRHRTLGEDHPGTVQAVSNMGLLLARMDQLDEALPYYEAALEGRRRLLGNDHPSTMQSVNNMAYLLGRLDRLEEAAVFYREVVERSRQLLGDRHPNTLIYINNTGTLYRNMGRLDEAEELAVEAVTAGREVLPADHWHLGVFLAGYGLVLSEQSRFAEAETALLEAYAFYENGLGSDHPRTTSLIPDLVSLYESWHSESPEGGYEPEAAAWRDLDKSHQP